jgi:hypothetical protein
MGLFDAFSQKPVKERQALIDLLVKQIADEKDRLGMDMAIVTARTVSARGWLDENKAAIVHDYNDLIESFFTRDPKEVESTLRTMGDRAQVVAAIPVYYGDGVTAVSFAAMAESLFPQSANLLYTLRQYKPGLPDSAYTRRAASEFFKQDGVTRLPDVEDGFMGRVTGDVKERQMELINHYNRILEGVRGTWPAKIAEKETALEQMVETETAHITKVASRHRALLAGFASGDSLAVFKSLEAAASDGVSKEILALGTGDEDAPDFSALTLRAFTSPKEISLVCSALLMHGEKVDPAQFLGKALSPEGTLPAESLKAAFNLAAKTQGIKSIREAALGNDENGVPWLARAASNDDVMKEILNTMDDGIARAAVLLRTARAVQDKDGETARALRERAASITGTKGYIEIDAQTRLRLEALDYVRKSDSGLKLGIHGNERNFSVSSERADAIIAVLAQNPDMLRMNNEGLINRTHIINAWQYTRKDNGAASVGVGTRAGFMHWTPDSSADPAAIMADISALPGVFKIAGELIVPAVLDTAWTEPMDNDADKVKLNLRGVGQEYYVAVPNGDLSAVTATLRHANPNLVEAGGELIDAARTANAWLEDFGKTLKFSTRGNVWVLPLDVEAAPATLDIFAADHGHVRASAIETFNPSALRAINFQRGDENGEKYVMLNYTVGKSSFHTKLPTDADLTKVRFEIMEKAPGLTACDDDYMIDRTKIDAVSRSGDKLLYHHGGGHDIRPNTGSERVIADLCKNHGFIGAGKDHVVNPAGIGEMFYAKGNLNFVMPLQDVAIPMTEGEAQSLMNAIAGKTRKDDRGMGGNLAASFAAATNAPANGTAKRPQPRHDRKGPSL